MLILKKIDDNWEQLVFRDNDNKETILVENHILSAEDVLSAYDIKYEIEEIWEEEE